MRPKGQEENIISPNDRNIIHEGNIYESIGLNENESRKGKKRQKDIHQSIPLLPITNDSLFFVENEILSSSQWPEDTIVDKTKLFVKLTKSEQERIGLFYRVDSSKIPQMEKFSRLSSKGIHTAIGPNHKAWTFNMVGYRKDFHYIRVFNAVYVSNLSCSDKRWNSPFYNEIDTLIPVIVENRIYWHLAIPAVLDSLPKRYNYLKETYANLKHLKKQNPEKQLVNYWNKNMILGDINYLELSKEELANIGIIFDSTRTGYVVEDVYTHKQYYSLSIDGNKSYSSISRDTVFPESLPILTTDEKGLNQYFFCRNTKSNKFLVDLFIPIKIPLNEYVDGINYDQIYWYNPTEVFINLLPDRIKYQLKEEKDWILNDSPSKPETTTCTFFEVCRSTLQIDNLKVYPNPAKNQITVEFSTKEDLVGNITITNMAGVQISQLIEKTHIKAGSNSFNIDISGLPSGLFIISINTDKGFKTQRLIVSQ